jgi:excisionase family DNA binding protein
MTMLRETDAMLTAKEAAHRLGVSDARIRQLLLDGTLSGHKVSKLIWLIPESEVDRYAQERRPVGRPKP